MGEARDMLEREESLERQIKDGYTEVGLWFIRWVHLKKYLLEHIPEIYHAQIMAKVHELEGDDFWAAWDCPFCGLNWGLHTSSMKDRCRKAEWERSG